MTVEGLQQGYCVIPSDKRFLVLYAFLKKHMSEKVMVFFSSCNSVKFHSELLKYIQIECFDIHGKQKQEKRTNTSYCMHGIPWRFLQIPPEIGKAKAKIMFDLLTFEANWRVVHYHTQYWYWVESGWSKKALDPLLMFLSYMSTELFLHDLLT